MSERAGSLDEIRTKVSGTTMGPDAPRRLATLARLRELTPGQWVGRLVLTPEWENPYDSDAILVHALLPDGAGGVERAPLGYVKNSDTVCDLCGHAYARFPKRCNRCGHSDHLRRDGAATRISGAMRAEPNREFWVEILDVTGGSEGKENLGCNIVVRSRVVARPVAWCGTPVPTGRVLDERLFGG